MSPFPQSVTYSSVSPAMFPTPPGIIEAAFVNLGAPKYLQWPRWGPWISVLKQVSAVVPNVQKVFFCRI